RLLRLEGNKGTSRLHLSVIHSGPGPLGILVRGRHLNEKAECPFSGVYGNAPEVQKVIPETGRSAEDPAPKRVARSLRLGDHPLIGVPIGVRDGADLFTQNGLQNPFRIVNLVTDLPVIQTGKGTMAHAV